MDPGGRLKMTDTCIMCSCDISYCIHVFMIIAHVRCLVAMETVLQTKSSLCVVHAEVGDGG